MTGSETIEWAGAASAERRARPRRRVLKGATLSFNRGYGALECTVRNLSDAGALLALGDTLALPPAATIRLDGQERAMRVRWRSLDAAGVEFV